jgi:hypothetical protein
VGLGAPAVPRQVSRHQRRGLSFLFFYFSFARGDPGLDLDHVHGRGGLSLHSLFVSVWRAAVVGGGE